MVENNYRGNGQVLNRDLRRRIIERGSELGFGHYCTAMSCIDACAYLYDEVLGKDDIFIMGKGHGIIAVVPILERLGKKVEWHPYLDFDPENGIEATTGSLGHGLPIALGRAFGKRLTNQPGRVYCMVGDGELQEGSNWEALAIAHRLERSGKLGNLVVMVDWNKYQAVDSVKDIMDYDEPTIRKRLEAFGCNVTTLNGHDHNDLSRIKTLEEGLNAVILDTQKGKGITFLEKNPSFHVVYWHERPAVYADTLRELGASEDEVESALKKMSRTRGH